MVGAHPHPAPSPDFWNEQRRVFITGATGLVGSWLTRVLLELKVRVVALVRDAQPDSELVRSGDIQEVAVVRGALEDFRLLERTLNEHEIDTVFHLGAQAIVGTAHRSPLSTFEANIRGTYNLLEACRIHSKTVERVVVASSDKAYGASATLPYTEDMPLKGLFPYEVSKSCADLLAQTYHHAYGLPVAIARLANVFGGGDLNWNRIVPGTIRSLLRGERPILRSDGTFVRDCIYTRDAAEAYLCLAENLARPEAKGQAFNFSLETRISVLDLVRKISGLMGTDHLEPLVENSASGEIRSQYLSVAKAHSILRWTPRFSLDEGLRETIDWYRRHLG